MRQFNETCQTDFSYFFLFEEIAVDAIQVISIGTFVTNFLINTMLIFIIIRTKQLNSTSVLIVFHFAIANCGMTIANGFLVGYTHLKHFNCLFEYLLVFVVTEAMQSTAFLVVVIAYDRYLKVSCLNLYSQKMTKHKATMICLSVRFCGFLDALLLTISAANVKSRKLKVFASVVRISLNTLMLFLCVMFYTKAILSVRAHRQNANDRTLLKQVDKSVRKLSTFYLASVLVLYLPALTSDLTRQIAQYGRLLQTIFIFTTFIIFTNPTLNGVVFMWLNRPAKRFLRDKFYCWNRHVRNNRVTISSFQERRKSSAIVTTKTHIDTIRNESIREEAAAKAKRCSRIENTLLSPVPTRSTDIVEYRDKMS